MEQPPKPPKYEQGNLEDPMALKDVFTEFVTQTDLTSPATQQSEADREAMIALKDAEWRFQAATDSRGELIDRIVAGDKTVTDQDKERVRD